MRLLSHSFSYALLATTLVTPSYAVKLSFPASAIDGNALSFIQTHSDTMQRHPQGPWQPWDYAGGSGDDFPNNYESFFGNSMEQAFHSQVQLLHHQQLARTTESKPRLSKEEVEILENEFQKNHKPSTIIKKTLADSMRVDGARINVSVQLSTSNATAGR